MVKVVKRDMPRVVGSSLVEINIKQGITNEEKEASAEYHYDAEIDALDLLESGLLVFSCAFALRKTYPEEDGNVTGIRASYYCGVRGANDRADGEVLAKNYATTILWSSFTSLCGLLTQQMGTSFPILPPIPDEIQMKIENEG